MSEIKIRVSTHDNDTTDIELSRIGTKLKVSLGDKKAEIDIAEFIPATMADRFLADATYDKTKKELVLITRKEGEEDKEFRVPVADIFQLEIEEVLQEGDFDNYSLRLQNNDFNISVPATGLGRIKGTDWFVLKFDNTKLAELQEKLVIERSKRNLLPSDVTGLNENGIVVEGDVTSFTVKPNVKQLVINNLDQLKHSAIPTRLFLTVNDQRIGAYFRDNDSEVFTLSETSDHTYSGDEVRIKLIAPDANREVSDMLNLTVAEYTVALADANRKVDKALLLNYSPGDYRISYASFISTGDNWNDTGTATLIESAIPTPFVVDVSKYNPDTLPKTIEVEVRGGDGIVVGVLGRFHAVFEDGVITKYNLDNSFSPNNSLTANRGNGSYAYLDYYNVTDDGREKLKEDSWYITVSHE